MRREEKREKPFFRKVFGFTDLTDTILVGFLLVLLDNLLEDPIDQSDILFLADNGNFWLHDQVEGLFCFVLYRFVSFRC